MRGIPDTGNRGFTLIELVVVLALLSIFLFFAIPRFERAVSDPERDVSRWMLLTIPKLKQEATSENRLVTLHIDEDARKLWSTQETMKPEEMEAAEKNAYVLPEGTVLSDVTFPDGQTISTGTVLIHFYPKGYSDRAILHLQVDEGKTVSYIIEPFLSRVTLVESYAGFSG
jgi:prepilin-type N-terminal cleavage/methylation domain-containing protein